MTTNEVIPSGLVAMGRSVSQSALFRSSGE